MHLRRALLLFALVLGLTALAAAVSPSREEEPEPAPPPTATPQAAVQPRQVAFRTRESGRPQIRRARVGEHIALTVASTEGGTVMIPDLGRTDSVTPNVPARFDLLAPPAGRYDVMLELSSGPTEARRIGTLVTRP